MRKQHPVRRTALTPARKPGLALPVRVGAFLALSLTVALAAFLVWPHTPTTTAAQRVTVDIAGFHPANLTATAGRPMQIQIINPDSSMHSDGGGWHELAIPELGINARIAPRSDKTVDIPATAAGEYAFYCDVCCGGKENPSMQRVPKVTA
jgi:cytochrome c oxidase subunit 2